jgi:type II secretory pathway component PulM
VEAAGPAAAAQHGASPQSPELEGPNVPLHTANVERGRIASLAGIVALLWLAILVLMIWQPGH